ncbi:FMN-binding protein [Trebonia sp.]|uniref:FMN-binding protein n=1 Tax=Trebonia sp. TaxID=2767075 RepID=UPI00260AADAE|nr:FMN-binding protein [Trebonia sp.]
MRRVILAVTATVAGLVALLSFKTHSSSERAGASPTAPPSLLPGERAVTGNVADTVYGPVQVQLVVKTNRIVKVNILQQPSSTQMDLEIGQYALPRLIGETITAQSARIDTVSGATYTSGGYIQSLQSALDNGG